MWSHNYTRLIKKEELKEKTMKDTLPNGMVIEGTLAQVNSVRKALGFTPLFTDDGIHYNSSTKGTIRIDSMDTQHIKNAIRKRLSSGVSNLDTKSPLDEFLRAFTATIADVTLLGLLQQLQLRQARGEK